MRHNQPEEEEMIFQNVCPKSESEAEYYKWLQELWIKYREYAPPSFKQSIENNNNSVDALTWEMLLANMLIDAGFTLERATTTDQPDLCIRHQGKRIWIECCMPTRGDPNKPDTDPEIEPTELFVEGKIQDLKVGTFDLEKQTLRFTSATSDKITQYNNWLKKEICCANDGFIIALHGKNLDFKITDNDLPDIFRPLYGMGDPYVVISNNGNGRIESGYKFNHNIEKSNGSEVSSIMFCSAEYEAISGCLFSTKWWETSRQESCYVKNVNTKNPCDISFSNFAQEYEYDGNRISMKK